MQKERIIGIVGGMGPYAGLDLVQKIFDQTKAKRDQEHLPVALLSLPDRMADRTAFLSGRTDRNPAKSIAFVLAQLERIGATVAGIPCNTAHAPPIFDRLLDHLHRENRAIRLLHLIEEAVRFTRTRCPEARTVGVLSTTGSYRQQLYTPHLESAGFAVVWPDENVQLTRVHPAITDDVYGIKAHARPVTDRARNDLLHAVYHLEEKGADAVILGCTEIPLALPESHTGNLPLIDATLALARALIWETYPDSLLEPTPLPANTDYADT